MILNSSASFNRSVNTKTKEAKIHEISSRQFYPTAPGARSLTKPAFPYRVIGTLSSIDVDKKQFGIRVKLEKFDPEYFIRSMNDCYADIDEDESGERIQYRTRKFIHGSNISVGYIYAAFIEDMKQFVRVRVMQVIAKTSTEPYKFKVHLLDYGMVRYIEDGQLTELENCFSQGDYQTGFALACQLPDIRLLNSVSFPKLENFKLGDHVEVYVLSDGEPCLAVFGSLASGSNAIPREVFSFGIDSNGVDLFRRAMDGVLSTTTEMFKGWAANNWIHSDFWTLVTVLSFDDLSHVAVRDVFASLQYLRLQQSINRNYKRQDFHQALKVEASKLFSGTPVIAYCMDMNSFIRGNVTNVHANGKCCSVEALDIPNLILANVPLHMVFYPASGLLNVPPLVFYFNFMKGRTRLERTNACDNVKEHLDLNSVALLKLCGNDCAQLETWENISINAKIENYTRSLQADEEDDNCKSSVYTLSRSTSVAGALDGLSISENQNEDF